MGKKPDEENRMNLAAIRKDNRMGLTQFLRTRGREREKSFLVDKGGGGVAREFTLQSRTRKKQIFLNAKQEGEGTTRARCRRYGQNSRRT